MVQRLLLPNGPTQVALSAEELGPDHVPSPNVIRASSIETSADASAQSAQVDDDERRAQIVAAWRAHHGDALAAARSLGMGRTAFYEAMRRYGIKTQR